MKFRPAFIASFLLFGIPAAAILIFEIVVRPQEAEDIELVCHPVCVECDCSSFPAQQLWRELGD